MIENLRHFQRRPILNALLMVTLPAWLCSTSTARAQDLFSEKVNVFIGTNGTGHTFPGPSMPFGMVQPGPDNRDHGWDYTSGYQYRDTQLLGFSQTRFSGTGINEMGDVLLMPINPQKEQYGFSCIKSSEKAKPGYYEVKKTDGVNVELTCSERVAFHRYNFPGSKAEVLVDLQHGLRFSADANNRSGLVLASDVQVDAKNRSISGFCRTKNWVERSYYFYLSFDQAFTYVQLPALHSGEIAPRYRLSFNTAKPHTIQAKIALSTVSVEGAQNNLKAEIPHWNFQQVYENNRASWEKYLSRIEIEAPLKQQQIFYTALYHLLLQPSNIADSDGLYRGADGLVDSSSGEGYYSTLSIWDIYRAAFPLLQIVAPEKVNGIVQSLLAHHRAAGFLPIWTAWGIDNYCMIGNHAIPMIVSAYVNGFKGFDPTKALRAMAETSVNSHIHSNWELYNQYGYYPYDLTETESVSKTLESTYDDWCLAEMAGMLGNTELQQNMQKRALYYLNLYDHESTFFRGRDSRGNWRKPFDPLIATSPMNNPGDYTEANAWQYFWTPAQHDWQGLEKALGGKEAFSQKLSAFFTTPSLNPNKFLGQEAMIGQYAHGNEPGHHVPYLFAFSKEPLKGQAIIHQIVNSFYNNTPDGLIGNDDCGQMSAWYILSTLGFYPINPASGAFIIGSPQVKKATINLPENRKLNIETRDFSEQNTFNQIRFFNGKRIEQPLIKYSELMRGGTLTFQMMHP